MAPLPRADPRQRRRKMLKTKRVLLMTLALAVLLAGLAGLAQAGGKIVSFNKASAQEIMAIEGLKIPESLAKSIVEHRTKNGPFKKPEDLLKVPGMTQDFIEKLNPVMKDGDVVFDPDAEPTLAPSKC